MLTVNNIAIDFGGNPLFENITFQIKQTDRIGLTGKNGAGKSTILKIIKGLVKPHKGAIDIPQNFTIGYLPQDINSHSNKTVLEETKTALIELDKLENEIAKLTEKISDTTDFESDNYMNDLNRLAEMQNRFELLGAGKREENIERILKGLGFESEDLEKQLDTFSGGWQMRVELAKILLQAPDLILLDEPTNHLDIESIIWLESFLKNYQGGVIAISHDKAFLDNVTNRTIEIVLGNIRDYKCNYSNYLIEREGDVERQVNAKKNQERYIKQLERNVEKFRAKASKAKFAQSLIRKLDNMDRIEVEQDDISSMKFKFPDPPRSGKVVVKCMRLKKKFDETLVFQDVNFEVLRGEKVAFVGKNGMGKTTLSKMIAGQIDYEGELELGTNLEIGFYAQHQAEALDGNKTVFNTIDEQAAGDMRTKVRSLLGTFLFSGDDVEKKVKVLSGGEKSRLSLAKLMLEHNNLLLLDEPTNHLDMRSKEVLKRAVKKFEGTVIIVSHDRDFLEGLTDKVFEFANHTVKEHIGDIAGFLNLREAENFREFELDKEKQSKEKKEKETSNDYELRKELRRIESKISKLEKSIAEIENKLKDPSQFKELSSDQSFFDKYEKEKEELETLMVKWEEAAEKLE